MWWYPPRIKVPRLFSIQRELLSVCMVWCILEGAFGIRVRTFRNALIDGIWPLEKISWNWKSTADRLQGSRAQVATLQEDRHIHRIQSLHSGRNDSSEYGRRWRGSDFAEKGRNRFRKSDLTLRQATIRWSQHDGGTFFLQVNPEFVCTQMVNVLGRGGDNEIQLPETLINWIRFYRKSEDVY